MIIIAKDPPNDTLINLLEQIYADDGIYISIISIAQLQFNILEHSLVPTHTKLNNNDTESMLQKYNIANTRNS